MTTHNTSEDWGPSIRAICRATSYEHYLELVQEEAGQQLADEAEQFLAASAD